MSLFDFFFPEQAQAMHLREIAAKTGAQARRASSSPASPIPPWQQKQMKWAEDDIGTLALVCESIIRLSEQKGLFTRQELLEVMSVVDGEDGRQDGKFKVARVTNPNPNAV